MKSNPILALVLVALSLLLNACSGDGGVVTSGIQCPRNHKPVDMNVPDTNKQKIALSAVDNLPPDTLAPGTYVEVSASLYYEDPNFAPDNNFRVEIRDTSAVDEKTKTRSYKAGNYCVRNYRTDLQNIGVSVQGVSKLVIAPGVPADSEARAFSFTFASNGGLSSDSKAQEKPASVGKVYETAEDSFIFKRSETEIEVRSKGSVQTSAGQTGTYYLSVVLVKEP